MRILVYEHLTASGPNDGSSMHREGRAMRDALTADLRAVPGVELVETNPDLAFVIAPETDGILAERVAFHRQTEFVVAPTADAIALTSDKLRLFEHWTRAGVPTPATELADSIKATRRSSVLKPRDGAGSCDTYFLYDGEAIPEAMRSDHFLVQEYVPGLPTSVAFLIGPGSTIPLPPCFQNLSKDGRFQYSGGMLPIPEPLARRALDLAQLAIDCVPGLLGYVGVDLVLGDAGDVAMEINPRLTTSYIGLRAFTPDNLAEWLIRLVHGERLPSPRWHSTGVAFMADGSVRQSKS
jgi:predicted ATP-grasp superfamily ATP-dependent carboligase